ncbi:MAG TPA: glycosyltransferase, partial [Candidatus Dormibacteraeota bacterium]|nr:glycosyltransferase [Candidatus Dormibacteraeota bacterium]
LAARLARRGHEVTVYCRPGRTGRGRVPAGVTRVVLPCVRTKYLETVSHTAVSSVHALFQGFDAVLMCNAANAIFAWIPRLGGMPVALNVDGLERNRSKWSALGRAYCRLGERLACFTPSHVVTDALVIQRYYRERYGVESTFIPYGTADAPDVPPPPAPDGPLRTFLVREGGYVLYVSRLEPENHAHTVVRAFADSPSIPLRLVVTGDAPYAAEYIRRVHALADSRTVFTGGVYGAGYHELMSHAAIYVQATTVGGVHPALVEAMGHGRAIVCADTPENREALGDSGVYFGPGDAAALGVQLERLSSDPALRAELGRRARARARRLYSWEEVASDYESLLADLVEARRAGIPYEPRAPEVSLRGYGYRSSDRWRALPAAQTATS